MELFMEVHSKHRSRMNQAWGMDNIFLIKTEPGGLWQMFTYKVKSFAINQKLDIVDGKMCNLVFRQQLLRRSIQKSILVMKLIQRKLQIVTMTFT